MVFRHRINREYTRLAAEGGGSDAVRMFVDVSIVMQPFDLDRVIAFRHVTRDEDAVAGVDRSVKVKRLDYRPYYKRYGGIDLSMEKNR